MMRVTGGKARGVPLDAGKGDRVRPATDRTREAIFSSLGALVAEALFLDLFAGSGAYGLEALSRGARGGLFVEQDRRVVASLEKNLAAVTKSMGASRPAARIVTADVLNWPGSERFDLIFVDPPYAIISRSAGTLFQIADRCLAEHENARLCFEHPGELELVAPGWVCLRRLGKGKGQPTMGIFARSNR